MDMLPLSNEEQCLEMSISHGPAQLQLQLSSKVGNALHCVGSLQVQRQTQLGFLCGSLPVPTNYDAMTFRTSSISEAAIVPAISLQSERAMAPQYRMLPSQTDLNTLLLSEMEPDRVLPVMSAKTPGVGVHELLMAWGSRYHTQTLARKCETLAVNALAGYDDEIDIIAPVDILKQIFKIPYSKARVSVAVHRVGRTLILNTGPDVEEGENLVRPKKNQAKAMEKSLFLKFAMQSVRAEACDCPMTQNSDQRNSDNIRLKGSDLNGSGDYADTSLDQRSHVGWQFMVDHNVEKNRSGGSTKGLNASIGGSSKDCKQRVSWSSSTGSRLSTVGEQHRDPNYIQSDSENCKRQSGEGFLRVLVWQLQEMRMLLGTDLLLFSNEEHVAVSLHLWDVERQVTPLMWLDAWLDNIMANVPELAICYHRNGVVQGYELLKTDDIFLLKGLSEDGTAFFHPHMVQQNALSVLRFLQENCKEDPGTYWLFKNGGEDLMQLFDLSVISKNRSATKEDDNNSDSRSSPRNRGKGSCCWPLGILLYRLAHRLSVSQNPSDKCKCANFFKKCLEFLGEQDHLFVRASAHEHVARLILKCHKELFSTLTPFLLESNEHNGAASKAQSQRALEQPVNSSESFGEDASQLKSTVTTENTTASMQFPPSPTVAIVRNQSPEAQVNMEVGETGVTYEPAEMQRGSALPLPDCISSAEEDLQLADGDSAPMIQNLSDMDSQKDVLNPPVSHSITHPVSARLAAVHHVSQAIKALRWQRQLQDMESKVLTLENKQMGAPRYVQLVPVCVCGEIDCIEFCDIRECEIGPFMDQKLWQLVLLLGESYLALGQAYKDDGQLTRALKAAELACSVYDSMSQHLRDKGKCNPFEQGTQRIQMPYFRITKSEKPLPITLKSSNNLHTSCQPIFQDSSTGKSIDLFWSQAWILVGDVHVGCQRVLNENKEPAADREDLNYDGLTMAQEVVKEVKRLRKKLGQNKKSCSICSLVRCSCQSDRASSGNSASSSDSSGTMVRHARKQCRKSSMNAAVITSADLLEDCQREGNICVTSSLVDVGDNKIEDNCDTSGNSFRERNTSLQKQSKDHLFHNDATVNSSTEHGIDIDGSTDVHEGKNGSARKWNKMDIFEFLQSPISTNKETNLLDAVACYEVAVSVLSEMWQGSDELQSVLRKKGWAFNELGRMRLSWGDMKAAEAAFDKAVEAFKAVKDHTNVVLIYCNIGHGKRASAETLVSRFETWKGSGLLEHISKKILDDAKFQYLEALRFYSMAQHEMKLVCEDLDGATSDLRNEVLTQYAHTYLRLGMLLGREEQIGYLHPHGLADSENSDSLGSKRVVKSQKRSNLHCGMLLGMEDQIGHLHVKGLADSKNSGSLGSERVKGQKLYSKKNGMTANDVIREAITLYESLGNFRAQEAAFAQFQLACHLRDCCLMAIRASDKGGSNCNFLQRANQYLSLADCHWVKALQYYKSTTHPDMFLDILMERSALYMAIAPLSNSALMLEMALSHLLEGRQVWVPETVSGTYDPLCGQEPLKPASKTATKFSQQLQTSLRTMLATAQNFHKASMNRSTTMPTKNNKGWENNYRGETHSSGRSVDVLKLKEMYRWALRSPDLIHLQQLYDMWMS